MTYSTSDVSLDSAQPVELYEFLYGLEYTLYTSADRDITHNSRTYSPVMVERGSVKVTEDSFKNNVTLTFHRSDRLASSLLLYSPDSPVTLTIYRGHYGDNDYVVYWKGRVAGVEAEGNSLTIECESIFTSMRHPGLRAHYEYTCRHTLYSGRCGAQASSFDSLLSISNIVNQTTLDISGAASLGSGWLTGGMIKLIDTYRFITSHSGDRITISRPFHSMKVGDQVLLYAGCDHTKETCKNKFNNIENFGGFPWVPTANPMTGSPIA